MGTNSDAILRQYVSHPPAQTNLFRGQPDDFDLISHAKMAHVIQSRCEQQTSLRSHLKPAVFEEHDHLIFTDEQPLRAHK